MSDNAHVDVLIKMRGDLIAEMDIIRNTLAGKQKQLDSLNNTIDLMRGWVDPEDVAPRTERRSYNNSAIKSGIIDFFLLKPEGSYHIKDICEYLIGKDLLPCFDNASRSKVSLCLRELDEVVLQGTGPNSRYHLSTQATNGSGVNGHASQHHTR